MNGRLLALLVSPGDQVVKGQRVAVLEAMKMEHQLLARRDGVVERVGAAVGEQLATRALVVKLAESTD
jgi:geranyl-CoA carboxylase alpha subunit